MAVDDVTQLQMLQQNLQNILLQKQQVENQLVELQSATKELKDTDKAYRIIGKIMLATPKEKLTEELDQKLEVAELRLKNIARQEENLQKNIEEVQQKVVKGLKQKNDQ